MLQQSHKTDKMLYNIFLKNIYCKGVQAAKFTILYMIKISLMTMKGRMEINMKSIIKGKLYDTATATLVADHQHLSSRDWEYEREELYIKSAGEWFLFGEGGPNSKYGERCGSNRRCSGEVIKPYTEQQAKRWLEDNKCIDEYIQYFGQPEE